MKNSKYIKIYLAAISYSLIMGFSFVFTKFALEFSDPMHILAHRFIAAFIALLIYIIISKRKNLFTITNFKAIAPLAIAYPLLFFTFQTFGLQYATSAEGGILLATIPIMTLFLSAIFLKERPTPLQIVSVLVSVAGVIFIFVMKAGNSGASETGSMLGIILLAITAITSAIYNIMAKKFTAKYKNIELLTVMTTLAFLTFTLLTLGMDVSQGNITTFFAPLVHPKYIIAILYLGVLSSLGTSLLTNYVLARLDASKMSVFANLGTFVSIFAGAAILGEEIFYFHIIGSVLIVAGVIGTNLAKKKTE